LLGDNLSASILGSGFNLGGGDRQVNKKLYVGNLDYGVTDEQLKEMFSEAGTVESATVITYRDTGRSKGFGFVEMADEESAQKAIEMFNEKEFQGRKMIVNEARPREETA
jgi:RNA recognition motif-containing protein